MPSMPLSCRICPKHPTFSDVSHMLTHVGSKGHLSHYFKAQVRSRQEPAVREQLHVYDRWYKDNHVEKLLSQRMQLKESKGRSNKNVKKSMKQGIPRVPHLREEAEETDEPVESPSPVIKEENVIDPQLSRSLFVPVLPTIGTSGTYTHELASQIRSPVPSTENYGSSSHADRTKPHNVRPRRKLAYESTDIVGDESPEEDGPSPYLTPKRSVYPDLPTPQRPSEVCSTSSCTSSIITADQLESTIRSNVNETIKLKGKLWPGMDIFDSASPESQRMRNQKKIESVTEMMQANSEVVEQTERIYWPGGKLKKERLITGEVDSSSPVKAPTPKAKVGRARAVKIPLATISTNSAQARRAPRIRKATSRGSKAPDNAGRALRAVMQARTNVSPIQHSVHPRPMSSRLESDGIEWIMNAGESPGHNRRLGVYLDDSLERPGSTHSQPDRVHTGQNYPFLGNSYVTKHHFAPHGLSFPNDDFSLQPSGPLQSGLSNSRLVQGFHQKQSTPAYNARIDLSTAANKENLEPIMDINGRLDGIDSLSGMGRSTQRYFTRQGNRTPNFYASMPPNMDFTTFHDGPVMNQMLNPLAFSFNHTSMQPTDSPQDFSQNHSPLETRSRPAGPVHSFGVSRRTFVEDSGDETIEEGPEGDEMLFGEKSLGGIY